jgi:hypothetical protein
MTASEFVTCMAVMAGAAKAKPRKPKQPRLVVLEEKPLTRPNGRPVVKIVHGRTLEGNPSTAQVPVKLLVCTVLRRQELAMRSCCRVAVLSRRSLAFDLVLALISLLGLAPCSLTTSSDRDGA